MPGGARRDALTELAAGLGSAGTTLDVLQQVVDGAVEAVPGCDAAGLALAKGRTVVGLVASDRRAEELDALQLEADGPAGAALQYGGAAVADLSSDGRWPAFGQAALERGVASLAVDRLSFGEQVLGVLSLYGETSGALPPQGPDAVTLQAVASQATLALAAQEARHRAEHLEDALATRDLIGQAKGVLMERHRLRSDDAFMLLRRTSQTLNRKLREVAEHLTETGELPEALGREPVRGLHCAACDAPVPASAVQAGGHERGLAYSCPVCEKRIEFAPVTVLASRREALTSRRDQLADERRSLRPDARRGR